MSEYPVEGDGVAPARRPSAFVVDVDGTLIQFTDALRRHLAEDTFDLDAYHLATVTEAPAAQTIIRMIDAFQVAGVAIIMSTYREIRYRDVTLALFDRLGVRPDKTYMRLPEDRHLANYLVKSKHIDRIQQTFEIICVADDDPAIEALCKERGIPVLVVPGWVQEADTTNRGA